VLPRDLASRFLVLYPAASLERIDQAQGCDEPRQYHHVESERIAASRLEEPGGKVHPVNVCEELEWKKYCRDKRKHLDRIICRRGVQADVEVADIARPVSIIINRLQQLEGTVVDVSEASKTRISDEGTAPRITIPSMSLVGVRERRSLL